MGWTGSWRLGRVLHVVVVEYLVALWVFVRVNAASSLFCVYDLKWFLYIWVLLFKHLPSVFSCLVTEFHHKTWKHGKLKCKMYYEEISPEWISEFQVGWNMAQGCLQREAGLQSQAVIGESRWILNDMRDCFRTSLTACDAIWKMKIPA